MPLMLQDAGGGSFEVSPVSPLPPPVPAPPAPQPTPSPDPPPPVIQARPILQAGIPYIDTSDVLEPPHLIVAPPVTVQETPGGPPGGLEPAPDDFDQAQAEADANDPDLSDLEPFELQDPFGLRFEEAASPPLKGGGAVRAIAQACADYGVDVLAAIANALHEGAGGGIGDGGTSYGPFQLHEGGALPSQFTGKGEFNATTNRWAWSENGVRYGVRSMVTGKPSARGLHGHAAVYAIVYGFERPGDKPGEYRKRAATYDKLVSLGSGWPDYAAALFKGPAAGGGTDTGLGGEPLAPGGPPSAPPGVQKAWSSLIDVYDTGVPKQRAKVKALSDSLVGVFK